MNRKIGFHLSIAGGMHKALEKARDLDTNIVQVFLKNSNRWETPPAKPGTVEQFKSVRTVFADMPVFAHTGYLINCAGNGENLEKSLNGLQSEIERAHILGINKLVLHPGSHKGKGLEYGINQAARSIDTVFDTMKQTGLETDVAILLETTAGQGNSIGHRFEHLQEIIEISQYSERLEICLDTCHIFAAGYDISSKEKYHTVMQEFDSTVGLNKLSLIHLNDSKKECGSHVDRHEHIGKGFIGDEGFKALLNDPELNNIPIIMETPKPDESFDRMNLEKVRSLII
ncbi:MAG: deoxyribonuclease IV [bacterium]|nr:deoxyribonuclease IV [bacterium]